MQLYRFFTKLAKIKKDRDAELELDANYAVLLCVFDEHFLLRLRLGIIS